MKIIAKPNLTELTPYQHDDSTTNGTVYKRYGDTTKNQYIERQLTVSPYTHEWTWGDWSKRASLTNWVHINKKTIEF